MNKIESQQRNKFNSIFIVFNMNSGKNMFNDGLGRVRRLVKDLRSMYAQARIKFVCVDTFADVRLQVKLACELKADLLIIAGGDGSLRVASDTVHNSEYQPKLMVFPVGTVNLVAHELSMPVDTEQWLARLAHGQECPVYPMYLNGGLFLSVAGVGFDSYVIAQVSAEEKQQLGRAIYMVKAGSVFRNTWTKKFQVAIDGQELAEQPASVLVMHGRYYAGTYYKIIPEARLSDEFFYVVTFSRAIATDVMKHMLQLVAGDLIHDENVKVYKAKSLHISSNEADFPVQADGDIVCNLPVTIEIAKRSITFVS